MAYSRDRNDRSGGDRGGFRSRPSFGDRPREMFQATCDNCGAQCQVPFRPTNGKPVYCSNCFDKQKNGGSDSRRYESRENSQPQSQPQFQEQFNTLNSKLDKILEFLESLEEEVEEEEAQEEIEEEVVEAAPAKKRSSKKA